MIDLYKYITESIFDVDDNIDNVKYRYDIIDLFDSVNSRDKYYSILNSIKKYVESKGELARPLDTMQTIEPKPKTVYIMFYGTDNNGVITHGGIQIGDSRKWYGTSDHYVTKRIKVEKEPKGVKYHSCFTNWPIYILPKDMEKGYKEAIKKYK